MPAVLRDEHLSVAPDHLPPNIDGEQIESTPTLGDKPLFGTQVTVFSSLDAPRFAALREEFEGFTAETGIEVRFVGSELSEEEAIDYVVKGVAAGDPPDITPFPQPGAFSDFARQGHLIDLGTYLNIEKLKYGPEPVPDLAGDARRGRIVAVLDRNDVRRVLDVNLKSMIWVSGAGAQGERLRDPPDMGRAHRT